MKTVVFFVQYYNSKTTEKIYSPVSQTELKH